MTGTLKKIYSAGIYARLSVDSGERKDESIETQTEIAKAFIEQQEDITVYDCYTDIGRTGTNFAREGFERMMCDVRTRRIDCIVVKDLSRFGRNHIETGNYIEKIFPFMGVRFIAVTDNFDSMNLSGRDETLSVNLKNLVNEMYAKDIAIKVKSGKLAKWEQGSYTGGIPPYGYRAEWIDDKKCLFVEETTSDIVKKIYELFLSGKSMREITRWLYENRVAGPEMYHETGQVYCQATEQLKEWSRCTLKMILKNPIYMGCLVQGRNCGRDYKLRSRHDMDSGDWSVREHTHEAIVSEAQFFDAAARFEESVKYCNETGFSKTVPLMDDIFAGILYCGDCGAKMKRFSAVKCFHSGKVRFYSYNCRNINRIDTLQCVRKSISLRRLTDMIKEAIRQEFSLSAMRPKKLIESNVREAENLKKEWNRQAADIERRIKEIIKCGSGQYLQYRMGEISEEHFKKEKEENDRMKVSLRKEKDVITERLRTIDAQTVKKNHFLRALVKGSKKSELTAEVVRTLIDRIEIYQDHRVKIIFSFKRSGI